MKYAVYIYAFTYTHEIENKATQPCNKASGPSPIATSIRFGDK